MGYISLNTITDTINRAQSTAPEKIALAARDHAFSTPIGPITYRKIDGQSTLGVWIGKTGFKDGKPALVDWRYENAAPYFPPDTYIEKLRIGKE